MLIFHQTYSTNLSNDSLVSQLQPLKIPPNTISPMLSQIKLHKFKKKNSFFSGNFWIPGNSPSLKPTISPPFAGDQNQPWRFVWNGRNCSKVLKFMPLEGNLQVVQGGIPYLFPEEMMAPKNADEWHSHTHHGCLALYGKCMVNVWLNVYGKFIPFVPWI